MIPLSKNDIIPFKLLNGCSDGTLKSDTPFLSIVIPILNEVDNIQKLFNELIQVIKKIEIAYEVIFIDDGSSDSNHILNEIAKQNNKIKIIQFRKNYGQSAALSAGFKYAEGDVIITLDGDLQNDPADIPMMLEKIAEGYDLVNGWRKNRKDKLISRKIPSTVANWIINRLISGTGIQLKDYGCTLKAYKRGIVKNISLYGEMHRFIPVFAAWLGASIIEIPVNHRPRMFGDPKYNLSRVTRVILDLIVVRFFSDYLTRPIQFFGKISINLFKFLLLSILLLIILKFFTNIIIPLNMAIILGGIIFFTALQFISIGLLGEIFIRVYFEKKTDKQNNDTYVIKEIQNKWE